MSSFCRRFLAPIVAAAGIVTMAGAPAANAVAPHANSATFVGTYTVHFNSGSGYQTGTLTLNADGSDHDQIGFIGTWSNTGKAITFSLTYPPIINEVFTGKQTKKGLCSKKAPCNYTYNGAAYGVWYAVKNP